MSMLNFFIILGALAFLMVMAYRGHSVILFAPVAALLAVLLTEPANVLPVYSSLFMTKMVFFVQNYFPIFMLGALFGKLMEVSGFAQSVAAAVVKLVGARFAIAAVVLVGAILTYGGVSLFVAVFAVYPFGAELFRRTNIPKRLLPATVALGAFAFTMDAMPGTPQIQNIIPTTYFGTNAFAAPMLGIIGSLFIFFTGVAYLEWRRRVALKNGEGYGAGHSNEPKVVGTETTTHWAIAMTPLLVVWIANLVFTKLLPKFYPGQISFINQSVPAASIAHDPTQWTTVVKIASFIAIYALQIGLVLGIACIFLLAGKTIIKTFTTDSKEAIAGSMLANLNTASEFGFAGVIASLPGFKIVANALMSIPNVLVNESVTVNVLAGVTGSASGGLSMALGAMGDHFKESALQANIPLEVMHRVASMASGGMDTLPHNGAVITVLAVTGLTHRQSYRDIFAITCLKIITSFFVIGVYYLTGLV